MLMDEPFTSSDRIDDLSVPHISSFLKSSRRDRLVSLVWWSLLSVSPLTALLQHQSCRCRRCGREGSVSTLPFLKVSERWTTVKICRAWKFCKKFRSGWASVSRTATRIKLCEADLRPGSTGSVTLAKLLILRIRGCSAGKTYHNSLR